MAEEAIYKAKVIEVAAILIIPELIETPIRLIIVMLLLQEEGHLQMPTVLTIVTQEHIPAEAEVRIGLVQGLIVTEVVPDHQVKAVPGLLIVPDPGLLIKSQNRVVHQEVAVQKEETRTWI